MDKPFTQGELYRAIPSDYRVTRMTILHAIHLFCLLGIIIPIPSTFAPLYQLAIANRDYAYKICSVCSAIDKLDYKPLTRVLDIVSTQATTNNLLISYGICKQCRGRLTRLRNKRKNNKTQ